jgi:AraC-like DNA-binding protein
MTARANPLTPRATGRASEIAPPTYPTSQIRAFTDALERLGFDGSSLLTNVGVRRSDLDDPDGIVPCTVLDRVIRGAYETRRVPDLAARLAAVTPMGTYPLIDYLVVTTDTVGSALEQLVRYFPLVAAPITLRLVHDDDCVRLIVEPGADVFTAQYETSLIVHHLRAESEQRVRVMYVSLIRPPDDHRELERFFGCEVRSPSAWSGIAFTPESMGAPLRRRDPVLRRVLEGHAADLSSRRELHDDPSTVASVRAVIVSRLTHGVPAIGQVARQLAMAPRTLQRRLAAEGVTYEQVVDGARCEAAERLLADATLAVGEIGYLLGFSEPSAFHRAFKRWHDMTPQDYRSTSRRERAD